MSDAKTQKRIDDLIARATHESTPAEEARTCAMLAVKMVAKHGAPKASHDYPNPALPIALDQLRGALAEVNRLRAVAVMQAAEIDGLKTEVMCAKRGSQSAFTVDLGKARFVPHDRTDRHYRDRFADRDREPLMVTYDNVTGRSRPMTDGEQRAYLDELYYGVKT